MPKLVTAPRAAAALLLAAVAAPAPAVIISAGPGLGATTDWAGVGMLGDASDFYGTGTLIGPRTILTAAHLVDGLANNAARFSVNGQTYSSSSIVMHPGYNGLDRYDLAVVTLTADVANATWYGINTGTLDETSTPGIKVGFGYGGDGTNGTSAANMAAYPFGTKRVGVNAIDLVTTTTITMTDARGTPLLMQPGLLAYDFDNHLLPATGPLGGAALGPDEANTTAGDSGGPMFQYSAALGQYLITGITVNGADAFSRFGDISLDVQVAANAEWIAAQVPEPTSLALLSLAACGFIRRRRR